MSDYLKPDLDEDTDNWNTVDEEAGVYIQPAVMTIYESPTGELEEVMDIRPYLEDEDLREFFAKDTIRVKRLVRAELEEDEPEYVDSSFFYMDILDPGTSEAATDSDIIIPSAEEGTVIGIDRMGVSVNRGAEDRPYFEELKRIKELHDYDTAMEALDHMKADPSQPDRGLIYSEATGQQYVIEYSEGITQREIEDGEGLF